MFDQNYFDTVLPDQFSKLGEASVVVVLHNGTTFKIREVEATHPGYVIIRVFPAEGVNEQSRQVRRKEGGTGEVFWDSVAVSYETISHVSMTLEVTSSMEPDESGHFGFQCQSSAQMAD